MTAAATAKKPPATVRGRRKGPEERSLTVAALIGAPTGYPLGREGLSVPSKIPNIAKLASIAGHIRIDPPYVLSAPLKPIKPTVKPIHLRAVQKRNELQQRHEAV